MALRVRSGDSLARWSLHPLCGRWTEQFIIAPLSYFESLPFFEAFTDTDKIVEETRKLPGYNDSFLPEFYSTISSFTKLGNLLELTTVTQRVWIS